MGWPERLRLLVTMVPRSNVGVTGKVLLMFWGIIDSLGPRGGEGGDLVSCGRTLHGSQCNDFVFRLILITADLDLCGAEGGLVIE